MGSLGLVVTWRHGDVGVGVTWRRWRGVLPTPSPWSLVPGLCLGEWWPIEKLRRGQAAGVAVSVSVNGGYLTHSLALTVGEVLSLANSGISPRTAEDPHQLGQGSLRSV